MFKEHKQSIIVFIVSLVYQLTIFWKSPLSDITELYLAFMVSWDGILYQDFVNPHAPLHALMWGGIFKIISPTSTLLIITELSVYSLISVFIYHICRNIGLPEKFSILASFIFIFSRIWSGIIFYGDSYATLFVIIGAYIFMKYIDSQKLSLTFITGLSFGISILYKQNIGLYGVIAVCIYFLYNMVKNKKISLDPIYLFLGTATPILLISLYFYYIGAFNDFFYLTVIYVITMQKEYAISCSPINVIYLIIEASIIGILLFRHNKKVLFISLMALFLLGRNVPVCYTYSSIPAISFFAVLIPYIIYNRERLKPYIKPITIIITIIFIGMYITESNRLYSEVFETKPHNSYHWLDYSDKEIVKFIKTNTNISDRILTVPSDYSMNIATERQTMKYPLAHPAYVSPEAQFDMINHLDDVKYILFLKNPDDDCPCYLTLFDYIDKNYRIVKEIDNVILLEKGDYHGSIFKSQCQAGSYINNLTLENNRISFTISPPPSSVGYYDKILHSFFNKS